MSELIPTLEEERIRAGLLDYLGTTFALADRDAQAALRDFLTESSAGIFHGPYVRLRLPYRIAQPGWQDSLDIHVPFVPYRHQAQAFRRLTSRVSPGHPGPQPTVVTTGTGSGKTEAFLYPILDHVRRARLRGQAGIKALILYPMNALANDQAGRLARILAGPGANPQLAGITAALYTGQQGDAPHARVDADGLIDDRRVVRASPPDILLTNYKMLDQLLLREEDQELWRASALSLRYVVLDEFHTYDGAQGTDVAMLLRRLGIALKSWWPSDDPQLTPEVRARPLGLVTPVATSATLGDKADPGAMLDFARTVFGQLFDSDAAITESRERLGEWQGDAELRLAHAGLTPHGLLGYELPELVGRIGESEDAAGAGDFALRVCATLVERAGTGGLGREPIAPDELRALVREGRIDLLTIVRAHVKVGMLIDTCAQARALEDLAELMFPGPLAAGAEEARRTYLVDLLAALSHIRTSVGLSAPSVELHVWVRELSHVDRLAQASPAFVWGDDGALGGEAAPRADAEGAPAEGGAPATGFPAIYCRHCGRSGWGVVLAPTGGDLDPGDESIRRVHAAGEGRFRPLIFAPREAARQAGPGAEADPSLVYLDVAGRALRRQAGGGAPDTLPVLTHVGPDAQDLSRSDTCPACGQRDAIRFVGSAIATMLSVTLSNLFGDARLDDREKKSLVFTDSVQDAAQRAGFVESRSYALSLRALLRHAVAERGGSLPDVVERALDQAGDDRYRRYRLLPPALTETPKFRSFWTRKRMPAASDPARTRVRRRLLLDGALEFGLLSRLGRSLAQTSSAVAQVDAPGRELLVALARHALEHTEVQRTLEDSGAPTERVLVAWVRGVLEHVREHGGIAHPWFAKLAREDGNRWWVWGGRTATQRTDGMPAFPTDRQAPSFPRIGPKLGAVHEPLVDQVTQPNGWYAQWTKKALGVTPGTAARLCRALFQRLAEAKLLRSTATASGGTVYALDPARVAVHPIEPADLDGHAMLVCDVCHTPVPATPQVAEQLDGAPCTVARCQGRLHPAPVRDNFYRRLYQVSDVRRITAREHSSVLPDTERRDYERQFKQSTDPDAPNVLVATPTLEMGIDIGDLSSVILASLPRTVASYLQRIGRAGRLSGNALDIAFVGRRGMQLPRLGDPSSLINGQVRPPATYLGAEGILRRQYIAYLADRFARVADRPHPRVASGAMGGTDPGTFLGDLIEDAEAHAPERLGAFLAAFPGLDARAARRLRAWATPGEAPHSSGLAAFVQTAQSRWQRDVEAAEHRGRDVAAALPGLTQAAHGPAATTDDTSALRSAKAAQRLVGHELHDLRGEYWVEVLERYGLFPNYTLVSDSVSLAVSLTWIDPETGEYASEAASYQRGSRSALTEFAPGSTFYANGTRIPIDSVDLGIDGSAVHCLAICPNCGYVRPARDARGNPVPVSRCPRCGGSGIADVEQQQDVVELTHVTTEVRRDESHIDDRTEERRRQMFSTFLAADLDPQYRESQWFTAGLDFGAAYFSRLDLRWFNAGRRLAPGQTRTFAGGPVAAAGFRVCARCGRIDQKGGANAPAEHKAWCPNRSSGREQTRTVFLSRSLRTQGLVVYIPERVRLGGDMALPSLKAAILLGLHERLGGSPDHLDVALIKAPIDVASDDEDALGAPGPGAGAPGGSAGPAGVAGVASPNVRMVDALLLHDLVPGGTGYLASMADPQTLWDVLRAAWAHLDQCECQNEVDPPRLACHKCLLPYAAPWETRQVSRLSGEQSLAVILSSGKAPAGADAQGGEHGQGGWAPPEQVAWSVEQTPPPAPGVESDLEQRFRAVLERRLRASGATVHEEPRPGAGVALTMTVPGSRRVWSLTPQVPVGRIVRPDFVLQCGDPGVPQVAIFTDGYAYHATPAHNRVADDAHKREALRRMGYLVLAVTAQDVAWADRGGAPGADGVGVPGAGVGGALAGGAGAGGLAAGARGGAEPLVADWYEPRVAQAALSAGFAEVSSEAFDVAQAGPIDFLVHWIRDPKPAQVRGVADVLPLFLAAQGSASAGGGDGGGGGAGSSGGAGLGEGQGGLAGPDDAEEVAEAARRALAKVSIAADAPATSASGGAQTSVHGWRSGHVAAAIGGADPSQLQAALVLDDRDGALRTADFRDSWRRWLALSNLLGPRGPQFVATTVRRMAQDAGRPGAPVGAAAAAPVARATAEAAASPGAAPGAPVGAGAGPAAGTATRSGGRPGKQSAQRGHRAGGGAARAVSPEWQRLIEAARTEWSPELSELLRSLAGTPGVPLPEYGAELGDGVPVAVSWPGARVLVNVDLEPGDVRTLEAGGWAVVAPDAGAIAARVAEED